jgi:hypothetical protein
MLVIIFPCWLAKNKDGVRSTRYSSVPVFSFGDDIHSVVTSAILKNANGSVHREQGKQVRPRREEADWIYVRGLSLSTRFRLLASAATILKLPQKFSHGTVLSLHECGFKRVCRMPGNVVRFIDFPPARGIWSMGNLRALSGPRRRIGRSVSRPQDWCECVRHRKAY